jgi:hypothetical protein
MLRTVHRKAFFCIDHNYQLTKSSARVTRRRPIGVRLKALPLDAVCLLS